MTPFSLSTLLSLLDGSPDRVAVGCALEAFRPSAEPVPAGCAFWVSPSLTRVVLARHPWIIHYAGVEFERCLAQPTTKGATSAEAHMAYCRTNMGGGHALLRLPVRGWTSTHRIAAHELPHWYAPQKVRAIEFDAWTPERWAQRLRREEEKA